MILDSEDLEQNVIHKRHPEARFGKDNFYVFAEKDLTRRGKRMKNLVRGVNILVLNKAH